MSTKFGMMLVLQQKHPALQGMAMSWHTQAGGNSMAHVLGILSRAATALWLARAVSSMAGSLPRPIVVSLPSAAGGKGGG